MKPKTKTALFFLLAFLFALCGCRDNSKAIATLQDSVLALQTNAIITSDLVAKLAQDAIVRITNNVLEEMPNNTGITNRTATGFDEKAWETGAVYAIKLLHDHPETTVMSAMIKLAEQNGLTNIAQKWLGHQDNTIKLWQQMGHSTNDLFQRWTNTIGVAKGMASTKHVTVYCDNEMMIELYAIDEDHPSFITNVNFRNYKGTIQYGTNFFKPNGDSILRLHLPP